MNHLEKFLTSTTHPEPSPRFAQQLEQSLIQEYQKTHRSRFAWLGLGFTSLAMVVFLVVVSNWLPTDFAQQLQPQPFTSTQDTLAVVETTLTELENELNQDLTLTSTLPFTEEDSQ